MKKHRLKTNDPKIIETLTALAVGELDTADAAAALGLTETELGALADSRPDLLQEAEARAKALLLDPGRTSEQATAGLAKAVETLARRLSDSEDLMTADEVIKSASLLERLVAFSKSREAEIKSATASSGPGDRLPLLVKDTRPNLVTGAPRLVVYLVSPQSPAWIDPRQYPGGIDWLSTHAPLSPDTGEPLNSAVAKLIGNTRFMNMRGEIYG